MIIIIIKSYKNSCIDKYFETPGLCGYPRGLVLIRDLIPLRNQLIGLVGRVFANGPGD